MTICDRAAIKNIVLEPEQEQFAGSVDTVFDELQNSRSPTMEHPFAIIAHGIGIGFFILREKNAVPKWAPQDVVTLHSFRIWRAAQGKGYGRAGVELARHWIRQNRPGVKRLMLSVNARNDQAKAAYLRCGFIETGVSVPGPIGKQHILAAEIAPSDDRPAKT